MPMNEMIQNLLDKEKQREARIEQKYMECQALIKLLQEERERETEKEGQTKLMKEAKP